MSHGNAQRRTQSATHLFRVAMFCLAAGLPIGAAARAQEVANGVSLKILNTRAPPGGIIQLTVTLTEPKPIFMGSAALSFDSTVLGSVVGVALYSPAGAQSDVAGAAVIRGNQFTVRATSPTALFGTAIGVPLLTAAITIRPDAPMGANGTLSLDPATSLWLDPSGQPYAQQVKSGNFQVAGTVSISDVFPSTFMHAGSILNVRGVGFQPGAIFEIDGVPVAATTFVSDRQLDVTIGLDADLYGRRVQVTNPDASRATYYAYLRAAWLDPAAVNPLLAGNPRSSHALLAATYPIFSPQTHTGAFFTNPATANQFLGLALQNPYEGPADVAVELRSPSAGLVGSTAFALPPWTRIALDVSEYFPGIAPPADAYLVVRSTVPVQMLGLLGDDAAGTVLPVIPALAFP